MKRCPTCDRTFEDSMKFCQTDGTVLVDANETAAGGNLRNDADSTKTKIMSTDELRNETEKDASPFGNSQPSWMDSQNKNSDDFSAPASPFGEAKSPDYSSPSSPFKDSEPAFNESQPSFNQSPFGNPSSTPFGNQSEWTPPPAPVSEWQNQNLGVNTPFHPPVSQGQNQTLPIVSLVLGIISLFCCWLGFLLGPAALITGYMGKNNANNSPSQYGGSGLALAGMITGGIGTLISIGYFVLIIIGIVASPR